MVLEGMPRQGQPPSLPFYTVPHNRIDMLLLARRRVNPRRCIWAGAAALVAALAAAFAYGQGSGGNDLPPGFEQSLYVSGLNQPTAMQFAPDGRLFVAEKRGKVRIVLPGGRLLPRPFISVTVETTQDRGLAGLALDPGFQQNGFVYLYYTRVKNGNLMIRLTRVRVGTADPNVADPDSEVKLLEIPLDSDIRFGGLLAFGADRKLYVGVGDSSNGDRGQNLRDLRGKILRLDPAAFPRIIPRDNPFVGRQGPRGEIWAYGVRNSFSGAILPGTNTLFANDVGQDSWEEINQIVRGGNYGWPITEGPTQARGITGPIYAYRHNGSAAITGGAFYAGSQFPAEYQGAYFFSDYAGNWIDCLKPGTPRQVVRFCRSVAHPVRLAVGPDGSLYCLSVYGQGPDDDRPIFRFSYVGSSNRPPAAEGTAEPTAGLAPLAVSFSAAASSDPDGDPLTCTWDFGDGTPPAEGMNVTHTYVANGRYLANLTVSDGRGGSSSLTEPLVVDVGNEPPQGTILTPASSVLYAAGETVSFQGTGTDPQDGELPASAFTWSFLFLHGTHVHPFIEPIAGVKGGSFTVPVEGEVSADQGYRIFLTVKDAGGLEHVSSVDIRPRTTHLTLRSNVPGVTLKLDALPQATPYEVDGVVGMRRVIEAPARQTIGGRAYEFQRWSDGGTRRHPVTLPEGSLQLEATYGSVRRRRRG